MAEGGEFGIDQPDLDKRLDKNADDDDDKEVDRTRPPSKPYHSDEQYEMQTMQHERRGLPETAFDESIPLLGGFIHQDDKPALLEKARDFIKKRFPRVDFGKLGPIGFSKKPGNRFIWNKNWRD